MPLALTLACVFVSCKKHSLGGTVAKGRRRSHLSKQETFSQCWFNVGPASQILTSEDGPRAEKVKWNTVLYYSVFLVWWIALPLVTPDFDFHVSVFSFQRKNVSSPHVKNKYFGNPPSPRGSQLDCLSARMLCLEGCLIYYLINLRRFHCLVCMCIKPLPADHDYSRF